MCVVVSDYAKGVIKEDTVALLSDKHVVFVDPKEGPEKYKGAFLVKPNMEKYISWNGKFTKDSALKFMHNYGWEWLVITDGGCGIHVLNNNGEYNHWFEDVCEVLDVTGAGDVVLSILACSYVSGLDMVEACQLASHIATKSVQKKGTSKINPEDIFSGDLI